MKHFLDDLEVYDEMTKYENKTLGEIDLFSSEESRKSYVGHLIERSVFGYNPNSKSAPDLEELELEIKSTPIKKVSNRYVSKERLALNIINYCSENWVDFNESSFWKKNKNLLIVFYEYFLDKPKTEYKILKSIIYKYPVDDMKIILNDWAIISKKVLNGEAHNISERDTYYLAACTKGSNSESIQKQPFSHLVAKQRAYSLKSSYMTTVFNDYVINNKVNEKIINNRDIIIGSFSIENFVLDLFKPYLGLTISELKLILKLNIADNSKSVNSIIINKIIGIKNRIENVDEFKKAGIIPKTIRVEGNGRVNESMSFPTFKFNEIINETWEESNIYNLMVNQQFLFIIFQKDSFTNEYKFSNVKFWRMPEEDVNQCRNVWELTKKTIIDGIVLSNTKNGVNNNLPKQKDNKVMHVRPHAQNKNDTYELPDGRKMTKQCFWLNRSYIMSIIKVS